MSLHPAVAAVRLAVRRALVDVEPGAVVLVACSGGADSLALLEATIFEGRKAAWRVVGATVDHDLQGGSDGRAADLVQRMALLGADETVSARVSVDAGGLGPEAAAREARYAVLAQLAEHLSVATVLLGHTRDDQAETVLMGLARGSGGRSIAGMRRRYDVYRRPLLDLSRADTEAACHAKGIAFWEDPHNHDPRFTRSRVRHHVLPMLETELGPGVAVSLARTADLLRSDMEYLDEVASAALPEGVLVVEDLAALAQPIRTRVLRLAALRAGAPAADLFHPHVVGMDRLITDWHGQTGIDLPGGHRLVRHDGVLVFTRPSR